MSKHRFGNRSEWCVEIMFERTLFTKEDAAEFVSRWQNGELEPEFKTAAVTARSLIHQAEDALGVPHRTVYIYW